MATHSSVLAWRIPVGEPGGLPSMGSHTAFCFSVKLSGWAILVSWALAEN